MISFLKWLRGYLLISCSGPMVERFLNQCVHQNILLWNLRREGEEIYCNVGRTAFSQLKDISKKTGTRLTIQKKCGFPYLLYRHRKRRIFALAALLSMVLLYVMSLFIWDIHIEGNESYKTDEILAYVTKNYVHGGQLISTVDTIALEEELRTHYDKFAWVSCEIQGTQLIIHIKETINLNVKNKAEKPADLIASKSGQISSIITRAGTPMVEVGQKVKKGDVLISGTISYVNDSQEVYEEAYVPADGDIVAKTQYSYKDTFSLSYYEKEYLDEYRRGYELQFFGNQWKIYEPKNLKKEYDRTEKIVHVKLGKTFYFPVALKINQYQAYQLKRVTYDKEQAKKEAERHLQKFCDNLCKKGVEIVENNVTISISGENLTASGTVTVLEPIGKISLIDTKQRQKEKTNEHSGETD